MANPSDPVAPPHPDLAAINRFIRLASTGKRPASSSGEKVARKLAKALHTIGDDMALLDREAIEGFHSLCLLAHGPWPTDEVKSTVFRYLKQAGG